MTCDKALERTEAALAVARRVPTDPERRGPGFAFTPVLNVPVGADPLDEALRLLGRDPEKWPLPS